MVDNGLMTSMDNDGVSDEVCRLYDAEGYSIRAIAKRLGLSRMKVHRTIAAAEAEAGWRLTRRC